MFFASSRKQGINPKMLTVTDFVKSIKEKMQGIALQLSYNVDLTAHKFAQIFTFLIDITHCEADYC